MQVQFYGYVDLFIEGLLFWKDRVAIECGICRLMWNGQNGKIIWLN